MALRCVTREVELRSTSRANARAFVREKVPSKFTISYNPEKPPTGRFFCCKSPSPARETAKRLSRSASPRAEGNSEASFPLFLFMIYEYKIKRSSRTTTSIGRAVPFLQSKSDCFYCRKTVHRKVFRSGTERQFAGNFFSYKKFPNPQGNFALWIFPSKGA